MRWVLPADMPTLFLSWRCKALSVRGKKIWNLVPAVICWSIWFERNRRAFEGYSEPSFKVYQRAKDPILLWATQCKGCELVLPAEIKRDWNGIIGCQPL